MEQYLPIFAMIVLGTLFAAGSLAASRFLGPKRPTVAKLAPYECGIVPTRDVAQRFPVRFYLVAMIFVIFDIEIIFLYPWAVMYNQLSTFGLAEMVTFSLAVLVAFVYLISNGALDWGPPRRLARGVPLVGAWPSTTSTVRQVPRPKALLAGLAPMEGGAPEVAPESEPVPVATGH